MSKFHLVLRFQKVVTRVDNDVVQHIRNKLLGPLFLWYQSRELLPRRLSVGFDILMTVCQQQGSRRVQHKDITYMKSGGDKFTNQVGVLMTKDARVEVTISVLRLSTTTSS